MCSLRSWLRWKRFRVEAKKMYRAFFLTVNRATTVTQKKKGKLATAAILSPDDFPPRPVHRNFRDISAQETGERLNSLKTPGAGSWKRCGTPTGHAAERAFFLRFTLCLTCIRNFSKRWETVFVTVFAFLLLPPLLHIVTDRFPLGLLQPFIPNWHDDVSETGLPELRPFGILHIFI